MLTTVTRVVLAAAASFALAVAPATVAFAQDDDYPEDQPQPTGPLSAVSSCEDGRTKVAVNLEDRLQPYEVRLVGADMSAQTVRDARRGVHTATFTDVPVGTHTVAVTGYDLPSDGMRVEVKPCDRPAPAGPDVTVTVECRGGWGVVHVEVSLPEGQTSVYSLSLETPQDYVLPVGSGYFVRISENLFEDGPEQVVLSGGGLAEPIVKKFTVKCASVNSPTVTATAQCDVTANPKTPASVRVSVTNPNRDLVTYTVSAGTATQRAGIPGGESATVDLGPFPGGDYPVSVVGSDNTDTPGHVVVDNCEDVVPDGDGLQVSVRCDGDESVVTVRYYAVGPYPNKRVFKVDGYPEYDETVEFAAAGPYRWTRYDNAFADGTYTARLTGDGLSTVEKFTVDCTDGGPGPTTTTAPPTTTTSGGPGPTSGPATTTSPGTTPPVAGGGGGGDLPVTGTAVGTMVAVGLVALAGGGALLYLGKRRKRAAE